MGQQETFKKAKVKADVCVQQDEKPSTAVMPEEVAEQPRRPQCQELVPAETTSTPKVNTCSTKA